MAPLPRADFHHGIVDIVNNPEVRTGKMSQVCYCPSKAVTLYASKTERELTVPISTAIVDLLEARKADGVASDLHVFARAAKQAKISYGRFDGDGFTLHSLRHTYITHLLANGVDAPTVMEYSGHKSFQSFSVYLAQDGHGREASVLNPRKR